MAGIEGMDREWVQLIKEARELGLSISEIYDFFEHQQIPELQETKE
jgi:DNA-binding transcriptional MerR regulator